MIDKKIYIAGKNGLVGSKLLKELEIKGYNVFSTDSKALDLRDFQAVRDYFEMNRPDYVVLVAAKHGGIEEYENSPVEYLEDNVLISGNVVKCAYEYNIKRLINIGASCVYRTGKADLLKEDEYDESPVQKPTEPYGLAKLYGMKLCEYYNRQKGTQFISVLPVNLYGDGVGYKLDTAI